MSRTKVKKLTAEQEALIPVTLEKWRAIALSAKSSDRSQTAEIIKAAYAAIGQKEPRIFFCDRPYQAAPIILNQMDRSRSQLASKFETKLRSELEEQLLNYLRSELESILQRKLQTQIENIIYSELERQLWRPQSEHLASEVASQLSIQLSGKPEREPLWKTLGKQLDNCIKPELWAGCGSLFDYCISVLNLPHSYGGIWAIFQSIVKNCGWIFPYEQVCIICDKPLKLAVDSDNRLHAEGDAAVQYADGFSIYAYHGVILPEHYGKLHPQQWKSKWLLKEHNAEVRRVLIQGIGYDRICQELETTQIDTWQEYTLLRIDFYDDLDESDNPQPVYLLKMTCPSTGFIHALRVPPHLRSARKAIVWVNWGIEPSEFAMQT